MASRIAYVPQHNAVLITTSGLVQIHSEGKELLCLKVVVLMTEAGGLADTTYRISTTAIVASEYTDKSSPWIFAWYTTGSWATNTHRRGKGSSHLLMVLLLHESVPSLLSIYLLHSHSHFQSSDLFLIVFCFPVAPFFLCLSTVYLLSNFRFSVSMQQRMRLLQPLAQHINACRSVLHCNSNRSLRFTVMLPTHT